MGANAACALRVDDTLVCWGEGPAAASPAPQGQFVQVDLAPGGGYGCALRADGSVACWGEPPFLFPRTYRSIAAGDDALCGIQTDGIVQCDGFNAGGAPQDPAIAIQAGATWFCALMQGTSKPTCWGSSLWEEHLPPGKKMLDLGMGGMQRACGLQEDGRAVCWGYQQGSWVPNDATFRAVASNDSTSCGITSEGLLRCWGDAMFIPFPSSAFHQVALGNFVSCGIRLDGTLECFRAPEGMEVPAGQFW